MRFRWSWSPATPARQPDSELTPVCSQCRDSFSGKNFVGGYTRMQHSHHGSPAEVQRFASRGCSFCSRFADKLEGGNIDRGTSLSFKVVKHDFDDRHSGVGCNLMACTDDGNPQAISFFLEPWPVVRGLILIPTGKRVNEYQRMGPFRTTKGGRSTLYCSEKRT